MHGTWEENGSLFRAFLPNCMKFALGVDLWVIYFKINPFRLMQS